MTQDFSADQLLADIATLVSIESPSHDVAALSTSAAAVAELLTRLTGVTPTIVDGPVGPQVHWKGGDSAKVLIVGHHDTVFPLGTLADRPFTVSDGRATGPGVFDMKTGIVLAAHALAAIGEAAASHVEVLITADEEVGSGSSRALIEERALACGNVLVLEPSADGGAVKVGRKGVGTFELTVNGKAAHAGLEPDKGVNALIEASHHVLTVAGFADPSRGTTVTPTTAVSGTAENVVPAVARVKVDVRVTVMTEAERIEKAMASLTAVDPAATLTVTGGVNRPPMHESASAELFAVARKAAASIGIADLQGVSVGGGSDGNFTAAIGVPTLDGLGPIGGGAHADHEWVDVATLPQRAALVAAILAALTT